MTSYQIYGVVVQDGEKERRYYGDCDSMHFVTVACDTLLAQGLDYAYAKQIGVGTVYYKESPDYKFRAHPLEQAKKMPQEFLA